MNGGQAGRLPARVEKADSRSLRILLTRHNRKDIVLPMKIGILSLVGVLLLSLAVVAEESPRGRLADGRAYRTDESGTQLVDYIAELEVNAEAMNRRIVGLEDELADKVRIIERLNRGETGALALRGELKERSLTEAQSAETSRVSTGALERAQADNKRLAEELQQLREQSARHDSEQGAARLGQAQADNKRLEDELRRLREQSARRSAEESAQRLEVGQLRAELETERRLRDQDQVTYAAVSRECAELRSAPKASCDGAIALAVQAAVREGGSRERTLHEELAVARATSAAELAQAQSRHEELEDSITRLKGELTAVRASLGGMEADLAGARSALAAAVRPAAAVAPATERMQVNAVTAPIRPVGRDYASRSRLAVVDSLRGSMLSDLNQVRSLVVTRDNLFSRSTGQGDQRVQFKPSPLISTGRRTLDDIAVGIRSAGQVHELTRLRTDLAEIRALVQGDIDLLRRTGRAG